MKRMSRYYRVYEDDFEQLSFQSDMDEGWEGHALIVEEEFKEEFIAEQVGRFTRHLLSILHEIPMRGDHNPFSRISKKYPRHHVRFSGDFITCPKCNLELHEAVWDTNMDDMRPCCPSCEYKFEMEED